MKNWIHYKSVYIVIFWVKISYGIGAYIRVRVHPCFPCYKQCDYEVAFFVKGLPNKERRSSEAPITTTTIR